MWWVGTRPRDVYLGTRAVHVCDGAELRFSQAVDGFEAALSAAGRWHAAEAGRQSLRIWLSGGLCRPFLLPEAQALRNREEMLRVATTFAAARTGLSAPCEIRLDVGPPPSLPLATAVEATTLEKINAAFAPRRLRSIGPWWAQVLNQALALPDPPVALAVQDCDSLTFLMGRDAGFERATGYFPMADRGTADATVARALLSAGVPGELAQRWQLAEGPLGAVAACPLGALAERRA